MSDSTTIAPAELGEIADRIRSRIRRVTTDILATGEDLITVKGGLPHGEFIGWIDREFGMTTRTAQRYIRAAEWAKDKNDIVSHLPPATVHLLAAPSTPADFTEQVVIGLSAGHLIDHAALQKEIRRRRLAGDTANDQTTYREFREKIGRPVRRSQQERIDEFLQPVGCLETNCGLLNSLYVERLYDQEFEANIIADLERAQRDLKRFLSRVRATYADRGDQ